MIDRVGEAVCCLLARYPRLHENPKIVAHSAAFPACGESSGTQVATFADFVARLHDRARGRLVAFGPDTIAEWALRPGSS